MEILWNEVPSNVGRQVSNVTFVEFDAFSSTVEVLGEYRGDCDYRMTIDKIDNPNNAFNQVTRIRYEIRDNVTGVGSALDLGFVDVVDADVIYPLAEDFASDLSIRFSSNVTQPTSALGTINVTVSGLNTSNAQTSEYDVVAMNTVSALSDGLQVRIRGPLAIGDAPETTVTVTSPAETVPVMNGMFVSFSDGMATAGDSLSWTANHLFPSPGLIEADLEAFEGYHLWRADLPNVNEFTLIGEIRPCDTRFDFQLLSEDELLEVDLDLEYNPVARTFRVIDRDIHDDFPYRFAVSTFDIGFLGGVQSTNQEGVLSTSDKLYPAASARIAERGAYVVPNPYKRRSAFEEGQPRVVFANLPTECSIRIYSVAADHVITLEHGPGNPTSTSATSRSWDLRTDSGRDLVPGIYIYYIEGTDRVERPLEGGGTEIVSEPFQQTGKMIVAR